MAEERVLRFGNLDDIIYVRKFEIMLLRGNLEDLEKENDEWMEESKCSELRGNLEDLEKENDEWMEESKCSEYPACKGCSFKEECADFMDEFYRKKEGIDAKIEKIGREIEGLLAEQMFTQSVFRGQPPI